ncbi:MAG: triose-phosphate isomerase [Ruminococcaceae bacterium]|nr:triose-phosphate isomerase [Oscillospiraceae bacterium]
MDAFRRGSPFHIKKRGEDVMKPKIRAPYFEIGTKNYIYGDKVLEYAIAADKAAEKYDIDVLFICPAVEIRQVAQNTKNLIILAPYMDTLRPGRGMADVLPEGLKAAGAQGVVINHCEKPMSLPQMKATIDRARELDFLVFACADTLDEAKAIANLHPDIINPEPSAIIGGGNGVSPMAYVKDSIRVIKEIDPDIMVEQAAGITNGQQVYDFIMAGSEAAGAASGIMNAADPIAMIDEMIAATRRAADDLKKQNA